MNLVGMVVKTSDNTQGVPVGVLATVLDHVEPNSDPDVFLVQLYGKRRWLTAGEFEWVDIPHGLHCEIVGEEEGGLEHRKGQEVEIWYTTREGGDTVYVCTFVEDGTEMVGEFVDGELRVIE